MDKKRGAIWWDKAAVLVIGIAAFFFIFSYTSDLLAKANTYSSDFACQKSIESQIFMTKNLPAGNSIAETIKPWPSTCRMQEVQVKGNTPDKVAKEVIKLMDRCWIMLGGDRELNPLGRNVFSLSSKCFVCFAFKPENMKDGDVLTDTQFKAYLEAKYPSSDKTYDERFNGDFEKAIVLSNEKYPAIRDDIKKGNYYGVVFFDAREPLFVRIFGWGDLIKADTPLSKPGVFDLSREELKSCLT